MMKRRRRRHCRGPWPCSSAWSSASSVFRLLRVELRSCYPSSLLCSSRQGHDDHESLRGDGRSDDILVVQGTMMTVVAVEESDEASRDVQRHDHAEARKRRGHAKIPWTATLLSTTEELRRRNSLPRMVATMRSKRSEHSHFEHEHENWQDQHEETFSAATWPKPTFSAESSEMMVDGAAGQERDRRVPRLHRRRRRRRRRLVRLHVPV
mmetsp:Transcript_18011/g.51148  ORF Transcript_18011/g.51148 Transcript_18011/m.51148 type:complete len:209 (+) Transcript_18011:998-1624(+)